MVRTGRSIWFRTVVALAALGLLMVACGGGGETAQTGTSDTTDTAPTEGSTTDSDESGQAAGGDGSYVLGVSNTVVGNGWREEMICSIKAQAQASGLVEEVIVINENAGPTEQVSHLRRLISQGVDAIIVNPASPEALNPAIEAAAEQGIVTVAVDQAVTAPSAYVVANDQQAYGRIGAKWLFEQLGGQGTVVEMRGIDGAPADTARHKGFMQALENYPDIEVAASVFTGWSFSTTGEKALQLINTQEIDGFWTSGTGYTVVQAFETANVDYKPVVGADNNRFLKQMADLYPEYVGAAVTNPAVVGAVGTSVALDVLQGEDVEKTTKLNPKLYSMEKNPDKVKSLYHPDLPPNVSVQLQIEPYTTYDSQAIVSCLGGVEQEK